MNRSLTAKSPVAPEFHAHGGVVIEVVSRGEGAA